MSPWQQPDNMRLWKRTALALFGLFLCLILGDFLIRTDKYEVDNNGPRFTSRRLMAAEETTDDSSDLAPIPVVDFWISGDTVPHLIDGGSVLMYNWRLTHTVKPEHTAINVTFKVDFPYLAFDESSVNISLSSYSFEMNETRINPMFVNWIQDQSTVEIKVDISEPLWINLTEPWRLPDCWWTPGQNCYKTSYEDCVFFDTSEEQNWDPAFCYHFNISQCLPHNTTSECFFVQPYECLSRLMAAFPDEPHELLCPVQPNTTCIQVNDRGLFFTQYDWTVPTKAPILATFNKEFCNMSTEEIWTYEEDRNGTVYTVDIFISEDIDRACRTVLMKLKPVPTTPEPTYNPYKELPTTLDYVYAKDCINVNATGFYYPPPEPINWQDFNLTVVIVGELPNFIDVNQIFSPVLATTISQQTRPIEEQITSLNASLDYTVRRPNLYLQPTASFSEVKFALKHEQFFYRLIIRHPEAINHGIEVTISFPAIEGVIPMAFLNVTPWWTIGANLVATTSGSMFNETHDGAGHFVTMDTTREVMTEKRSPGIVAHFASSEEGSGIIDKLVFQIEPFINVMDQRNSGADMIMMWFYSRVLTEVLPGQQLELKAKTVYKFTRDAFSTGSSPKVTITDQPFVPLIPASDRTLSPDSADLVRFTFDLSHTLDFDVNDIWMNVSCPDLQIIPGTLEMDFLEPDMNMTTNSSSDLSFTTETTYHIHLVMLAPGVNLLGNQTFLMWNNSMLTHQEIICNVMLSYRKGTEALILPYLAGHSPAVTLQGIHYVLYPKDLVGQNDTMYYMPVGSNATFILNVTFSETTTKLDIRLKMPGQVLAVYYAHVIHQGTRLTLEDQGNIAVETTSSHVDDWDIPARTVVDLDFGMVENFADNKLDSTGDNLILEFNVVLENTTDLVSRDKEHTLTTTVSYSNGKDLVQEATVHVWEPEMILMYNLTNETLAGDPGDVFQYYLYLTHTEPSQTPAHHILIEIYLPYMAVYQDFIPGNLSDHVPKTQIIDELGMYEADGKLQLYVFKMAVGEILEGTFLIQISTKLTEGMALLATSQYHIYSFYQWGRVYHYSAVSDNVINIRNATLVFDGTSHPQTPDNTVTINEQVMYSMVIPVPPIPSNLSVTIYLPQFEVSLKTWEVMKLREELPRRPFPIEGTFVRQGCFPNQTVITDACFCSTNPLSGNGIFYRVYPDWLETCMEIPKENCTGVEVDGGTRSTRNQTVCNGTSMNCTQCGYNNTSNCSVTNDTYAPENITSQTEVCVYDDASYDICFKTVLKGCHLDANLTTQWSHIFSRDRNQTQAQAAPTQHPITNHTTLSPTYANETTVTQSQPANQTADEHTTPNPTYANENAVTQSQSVNQTADEYTTPSPTYANETAVNQSQSANQTVDEYTTPSPTYANETAVNQSQPANQTVDEYSTVLSCEEFAEVYCQAASLHHCILPEAVYNETGAMDWNATCACTYYEPPPPAPQPTGFFNGTNVTAKEDPYLTCRSRDNLEPLQTSPSPNSSNSTSAPSMLDVCDEEETLLLGMASVVHTEIWSTREGSVCTFIGGNLHSPFQPGVFYISEHLPANLSMGGSTIRVTVTMVILDLPDLSRGDVLLLNATSAFSYLSYPVPPSDIFRENCTCQKLLEDHLDAATPKECSCETWHLHNMTDGVCNCTSYFVNEDAGFEERYSCNCINFCFGVLRYFLNPPHVATLEEFDVDSCDCVALNATLLAQGLTSPLQHHVDSCLVLYQRNYTCTNLTYTLTHHTVPVSVNCACENTTVEGVKRIPCSCDPDGLTAKIQQSFKNKVTLLQCLNWTITSVEEMFQHTFNRSDCSCGTDLAADAGNQTSTVAPVQTTSSSTHNDSSTNATTQLGFDCSCEITCSIHVEQDCIGSDDEQCSNIEHTHTLPLDDSMCKCHKIYNDPWNISDVMEWYQPKNYTQEVESFPQFENASLSNSSWFSSTFLNGSNSNITVNLTDINTSNYTYELECDCIDIDKVVYHVSPSYCVEHHAYEVFDCDCLVPPDNETQFILDHWDHNATIIDQMITRASHEVIIIEPSLQITFTRRPEPSIVDSIDQVIFEFQISHTEESDAPAFNVTLQLDAVNFTRNTGAAKLVPSCAHSDLCDVTYNNFIGQFHLPLLPVDPPGAVFEGMFNLSVGNHLDFVANSLITATGIAWYDSSIVDFPGRLYPSIAASDTIQIDAPTISTSLNFTTANTHYFFTTELGDPPKTFSIGDYVRMKATLWIPEITLQFLNFSIEAVMQNFTAGSAQCLLSQRIYNRTDTPSVYPEVDIAGKLFPGSQYNNCRFLDTGISVTPGVIVNEADNIADEQDFIHLLLTFRVEDEPYWVQGVEVPFTMSATYVSDYTRIPVLLVDDSIVMTVVEPQLSLRVELLDHPWQIEQVVNQEAEYTCNENTCCDSEDCNAGTTCITATDSIDDCATAECRCYSGYTSNELEGCTAVGRTAGDILSYGLTVTHHVDYTGNAFDLFIVVHSDLPSDLIQDSHFFSHPPPAFVHDLENIPSLQQLNFHEYEVYILRFNQAQMCERFVVPHRIHPEVEVYAGMSWKTQVSMWYNSAKPYNVPVGLNPGSRLYRMPKNITFNLTAPAPSSRFLMLPLTGGSSAIDFEVYSSSEVTHEVTVNLRKEREVSFRMEVVVPKISCNMTVLLALPEGNGFQFDSVRIVKMGSRISFPTEKLSNESLTTDIHGNKFFFAELPDIYSQPNTITKQRELNSTIQQRFKTMKGDQQPYPTDPSCISVNGTNYEKAILIGCFHDLEHFFDVAKVTTDHPENLNFSKVMTRELCQKLCREDNFYISATKNGSDCHCGNHTTFRRYADTAHSLYTPYNHTFLEPYYQTVFFDCNKTRLAWNNYTVVDICMDQVLYQSCLLDSGRICRNETLTECRGSFAQLCQEEAEVACGNIEDSHCLNDSKANCTNVHNGVCLQTAEVNCRGTAEDACLKTARESFYLYDTMISEEAQACCVEAYAGSCVNQFNETCAEQARRICVDYGYIFVNHNASYETCLELEAEKCMEEWRVLCAVNGSEVCQNTSATIWNDTAISCHHLTITLYNVTTANCTSQQLPNCTACLYENLMRCEANSTGGNESRCIEEAVVNCNTSCVQQRCEHKFYEVLESYLFQNCSQLVAESYDVIYLGNCSEDLLKWRNVTKELVAIEPVTVDFCDVPCTGNSNMTCGGADFILIYGPLEGSIARQQCEWYAGLYDEQEDVFSFDITLSITPLLTKGITEILQPFVTYDHGEEHTPTILPSAPYRLEAGTIWLDMNVWVAPEIEGFVPGDLLEFYTEVFHNPLSTITARDISIVWMFPTYVEYVNLTNHKTSLHEYNALQPAEALRTDPTKGFQFFVPTLRNTDMISFHFLIKLDPARALPQGEYHMVALAETYYYSWDLYNPHEDEFKHNVLTHFHDVIPTKISFEVPTTYMGRPELSDLKLSTYSALYDEQHNIMYACFYNNTKHFYEGGCFMTGNLPAYEVELPPTCDDFCNCTYVWDLTLGENCSQFEPKPENCSCGCVPDCLEIKSACEDTCHNCTSCTYNQLQACLSDCTGTHLNCTQECCLDSCSFESEGCLLDCSNCTVAGDVGSMNCTSEYNCTSDYNCTFKYNCTLDCSLMHGVCAFDCLKPPDTCTDNCTSDRGACQEVCEGVCKGQKEVHYPGVEVNCTEICDWDCVRVEDRCRKGCCMDDCGFNQTICVDNCLYTCKEDDICSSGCQNVCIMTFDSCSTDCDPPTIPCTADCNHELSYCEGNCNQTCALEICEVTIEAVNCTDYSSGNTTSKNKTADEHLYSNSTNCTSGNCTSLNTTQAQNCSTKLIKDCSLGLDTLCHSQCSSVCFSTFDACDEHCCLEDCILNRGFCIENCTDVCAADFLCLQACSFSCADQFDRCNLDCIMPFVNCRPNCDIWLKTCRQDCHPCGGYSLPNQALESDNGTNCLNESGNCNVTASAYGDRNQTIAGNQTLGSDNGSNCLNQSGNCNATASAHRDTNQTIPRNQTYGNNCFNESVLCNGTSNSSTCQELIRNCTEARNISSTMAPTTLPLTPVNCSVELVNCRTDCDGFLEDCRDQCPCEEPCFSQYSNCSSSCYGCEAICLDGCRSNCSAATNSCMTECIEPTVDPVNTCTETCSADFTECLPGCLQNLTVNITRFQNTYSGQVNTSESSTRTFLNVTCLEGCVATSIGCLVPCFDLLSIRSCSDICFPETGFSDNCSAQCHTYAYGYSNATLNRTFEGGFSDCMSSCSNWTQHENTSSSNSTSGTPTETLPTDLPNSTTPASTTTPIPVGSSSTYTTQLVLGSTASSLTMSSTSKTGHCVKECRTTFPYVFANCSNTCLTEFENCTDHCVMQNTSVVLNESLGCYQDCGQIYQVCNMECTYDLVFENCSLPCEEVNDACLETCLDCLDCRDDCHWKCNSEKSTCLGICFPVSCEDSRTTCLDNCTSCSCTNSCQTNCSFSEEVCSELCLPGEVKLCKETFTKCAQNCSRDNSSGADVSTHCVLNCSLGYYSCMDLTSANLTDLQNCSFDRCSELDLNESVSEVRVCNASETYNTTSNDTTAVSCSTETKNETCKSFCLMYQSFNSCVSSCNNSLYICLDNCEECLNDTECFETCANQCVYDHHKCYTSCHTLIFLNQCTRDCQGSKADCDFECTNCTTCPDCLPTCQESYANCSRAPYINATAINGTTRDNSIHPNCTAYHICLSPCHNASNETCLENANCSATNCTQACLQEFISSNCTSQENCSEYSNLCVGHQRRRRSLPVELLYTGLGGFNGHPRKTYFPNIIIHKEMKQRYLKEHLKKTKGVKVYGRMLLLKESIKSLRKKGSQTGVKTSDLKEGERQAGEFHRESHTMRMSSTPGKKEQITSSSEPSRFFSGWMDSSLGGGDGTKDRQGYGKKFYNYVIDFINRKWAAKPQTESRQPFDSGHRIHRRSINDSADAENGTTGSVNQTQLQGNTTEWPDASNESNTLGPIDYDYPVCVSNMQYLHYQSCLQNCSLLLQICDVQCNNYSSSNATQRNCTLESTNLENMETGYYNETDSSNSTSLNSTMCNSPGCSNCTINNSTTCSNSTVSNSTSQSNSTTCISLESCINSCSGNCVGICEQVRPDVHRECFADCNNTVNYCSSSNTSGCSHRQDGMPSHSQANGTIEIQNNSTINNSTIEGSDSGNALATNTSCSNVTTGSCDSTNLTTMNRTSVVTPLSCSDKCALPQYANLTTCQFHCDNSSAINNCFQVCDNTTCEEPRTCNCSCECFHHPELIINLSCTFLDWSHRIGSCLFIEEVEVCSCACGCVEPEKIYEATHWRALHSTVGNLLGVDPLTNTLYALSHHGLAIMRSHDFGESWFAIKPDVLDAARDSESFVLSMSLSEEILLEMEPREVVFASSQWNDTWGVSGVGIHRLDNATSDWEVVGTWQCCKSQP